MREKHQGNRERHARAAGTPLAPLSGAALALLAGCGGPLDVIDRDTNELIRERSEALGRETLSPRLYPTQPREVSTAGIDEYTPPTNNPDLDDLEFIPAPREADDFAIAARLQAYADNALGTGPDPDGEPPVPPLVLRLADVFRTFQLNGRTLLFAQEDYFLSAISLLQERRLFTPRFFNETSAQISGFGDEGRFEHATTVINSLGFTNQLLNGGSISAEWLVQATDQLRDVATGGYVQSSTLVLSGTVPLLAGAGPVARENLIQAERDLVYQARDFERTRRELLVDIADDYFDLLQLRSAIGNLQRQIAGLRLLADQTAARVEAGRLRPFQSQLARNEVLGAEANLAGVRENYILSLQNLKIRLGIPIDQPIQIADLDIDIPAPQTTQAEAARAALHYRLDLQTERDQLDDTRRAVRNARNALLPDLDIAGSVSIPTPDEDPTGGIDIDAEELNYTASVTLGLPLDRRIERLALRGNLVLLERAIREYRRFADGVVVAARAAVRDVDIARFQLQLAERQVEINELRLEDQRLRDDSDPQAVVDSENALLASLNERDQARTDLRNAVLNYLLATGQLRVADDGTFAPLPGMVPQADGGGEAPPFADPNPDASPADAS